jgi:hypothetical protein
LDGFGRPLFEPIPLGLPDVGLVFHMSELQAPFNPPGTTSEQPETQSGALVPFQLDSQVAATFQRLRVKLSSHDLSIPEGLSSGDFLQLAKAVARVEEIRNGGGARSGIILDSLTANAKL